MEACYKAAQEVYAETSRPERRLQEALRPHGGVPGEQYLWWQVAEYSFDSFMIRARGKAA